VALSRSEPIVSIDEARKLLGDSAVGMTDMEILNVINTLDLLAQDALKEARRRLAMKKDARELAEVIYSEYKINKQQRKQKS
jgi:hypothetical protein